MLERITALLSRPRGPAILAGVALLLSLPALWLGFQLDDHLMQVGAASPSKLPLWEMPAALLAEQRQRGFWSWWSSPHLHIAFFRPLSWWTHRADFYLWPDNPVPMLLSNVLLYAAMVWVAALTYRRLLPDRQCAALAALMFAVDEAHAGVVSWIACRNSLLAAFFSVSALWVHARARETRSRWQQAAAVGLVLLALLSGEAGVASLCYLLAYALVLEPGLLRERVRSVVPAFAVGVAWASYYFASGYGMRGTGWYRELSDPIATLRDGLSDLPLWISALFGSSVLNLALTVPPLVGRLITLPIALLNMYFLLPLARASKQLRFFAVATGLAIGPLLLTVPQDRLTLSASFAGFGWLAGFITIARDSTRAWVRVAVSIVVAVNVWFACANFPVQLFVTQSIESRLQALASAVPPGIEQAVLLNSPIEIIDNEVPFLLGMDRRLPGTPESLHTLYAGDSALDVLRVDDRTLEVTTLRGWGYLPIGRIFCALRDMPRLNEVRRVSGMSTRVVRMTESGLPAVVRFEFDSPLEHAARAWLVWRGRAPQRWSPPPVGEHVAVPGASLFDLLPTWPREAGASRAFAEMFDRMFTLAHYTGAPFRPRNFR